MPENQAIIKIAGRDALLINGLGQMSHPIANRRLAVELITAVVVGLVFVRLSSWCDPGVILV